MEGLLFFIVVFGIFFVVVVRLGVVNAQKTRQAWSAAARTLGIDFTPAGIFSQQRMEGTLPTGQVIIETFRRGSGKHSHTYTRYRALYRAPLELGLRLTQEGFLSGLGRLLGAQDIEVGDADFDNEFIVKGGYPVEIAGFLTPSRRLCIRRAFASFPGLILDDREVRWETRGVHRDPEQIVSTVTRLSQLAWELSGRREEGQQLEEAVESQKEERSEEGIEPRVVEEEVLHLAAGDEDVPNALQRFLTNAPDDEIIRWAERVAGIETPAEAPSVREEPSSPPPLPPAEPPPMPVPEELTEAPPMPVSTESPEPLPVPISEEPREPPAPAPVEPAVPQEAAAAPEVVSAPQAPLDVASVCGALFSAGSSSLDASRILEERYQGKRVDWSGVLKSVESYSFDWIFGNDPGTKAIIEIYEVPSDVYGHNMVQAVLQLGAGEDRTLRECVGKTFSFQGTLLRADGLMRNLYLKDGSLRA